MCAEPARPCLRAGLRLDPPRLPPRAVASASLAALHSARLGDGATAATGMIMLRARVAAYILIVVGGFAAIYALMIGFDVVPVSRG